MPNPSKRPTKDELKARLMNFGVPKPQAIQETPLTQTIPPAPTPLPETKLTVTTQTQTSNAYPITQPALFPEPPEPAPEIPEPLQRSLLEGSRKRKSLRTDPSLEYKGFYLSRSLVRDIRDMSDLLDVEQSRLVNALLMALFAHETAPEAIKGHLEKLRRRQALLGQED